jgi:anti-sigma factor (TIGR02949 family)
MNQCSNITSHIALWLDGELQGEEKRVFESHLEGCERCSERVSIESEFLNALHSARQAHEAPTQLRNCVIAILEEVPVETPAPSHLRNRITESIRHVSGRQSSRNLRLGLAVATLIIVAVALGLWLGRMQAEQPARNSPSSFAMMAANTHRRYLDRQLPLEIASASPEEISDWFDGKVPFSVKLPKYQEASGQVKLYQLEGARLVGYKEDYAAYVAYRMGQRPISLVMTSNSVAQPAGGEEIMSRGLTFHFDSIYGYKVLTWTDRGLTYALVSDLEERGQQSCGVCHQGVKDHDLIDRLKPTSAVPSFPSQDPRPIF